MFRLLGLHFSRWLFLLTPLRVLFRIQIKPTENPEQWIHEVTEGHDVIYVLPRMSILDLIAVNKALKTLNMPRIWLEAQAGRLQRVALLSMRTRNISFLPRSRKDFLSPALSEILKNDPRVVQKKILLMPVQVFWSRVPDRNERNILLRSLFPDEGMENVFQKYFMLFLHGGQLRVHFSAPMIIQPAAAGEELLAGRRLRRSLIIEFQRERTAACGPVVYDLATVSQRILANQDIKKLVGHGELSRKQMKKAAFYLREIAAKYNYNTIRAVETLLDFVWTRIFQGVRVRNLDPVAQIAKTGQVIWMPCHRSHLDYLLLSYLMKRKGLAAPHIAAGVNLSFFPIGPILRRGGAFFLRRTFAGNKLYSAVFSNYVDFLLTNGYPVEFFHEGGRSRIGKLLPPKTGLTSMCVSSILKRRAENTFLCPVYISYDKVMEDNAYARELSGAKKERESFWQLLKSLRFLFSTYGRVEVAFGTPIRFGDYWSDYVRRTQSPMDSLSAGIERERLPQNLADLPSDFDLRDSRIQALVRELSRKVNQGINSSASASDTALLASVILANSANGLSAKHMQESECLHKVAVLRQVISDLGGSLGWLISAGESINNGFNDQVEFISNTPQAASDEFEAKRRSDSLIASAVRWGFLERRNDHTIGQAENSQLNLWWYRGTIFHLLAIPGIVAHILFKASGLEQGRQTPISEQLLESQLSLVRQLWDDELFWPEATSSASLVRAALSIFERLRLIKWDQERCAVVLSPENSEKAEGLKWFATLVQPETELYSIQLGAALTLTQESGMFRRDELLHHTVKLHRSAFLRGQISVQSQLSQVFGGRISDCFSRARFYISAEGVGLTVNYSHVATLSSFLSLEKWREYSL